MTSLSHAEAVLGYETLEDPSLYYKVRARRRELPRHLDHHALHRRHRRDGGRQAGSELRLRQGGRRRGLDRGGGQEGRPRQGAGPGVRRDGQGRQGQGPRGPRLRAPPAQDDTRAREAARTRGRSTRSSRRSSSTPRPGPGSSISPRPTERRTSRSRRGGTSPSSRPSTTGSGSRRRRAGSPGLFVRDADSLVSKLLEESGNLVSDGRLEHEYPTCWRSGHRLVWVARREYFYWIDRVKDKLVEAAEKVEYYFDQPRNRFIEFLKQSPPWCISRERVWGTPLPIWVCTSLQGEGPRLLAAEHQSSRPMALPDGKDFELHRPWIDRIVLRCPKCGGELRREPFVLDTWHNSGSAPLAAFTDEERKALVPVEHLTEGIDQTRGWAYTLLVLNVDLRGEARRALQGLPLPGARPRREGPEDEQEPGERPRRARDAQQRLGRPPAVLHHVEELAGGRAEPRPEGDDRKAVPDTQHALPPARLPEAERRAGRVRPGEAHRQAWAAGKKLLTQVDRWLLSNLQEAVAVRRERPTGRPGTTKPARSSSTR